MGKKDSIWLCPICYHVLKRQDYMEQNNSEEKQTSTSSSISNKNTVITSNLEVQSNKLLEDISYLQEEVNNCQDTENYWADH
jgi:hypothetical protein